MNNILDYIPHLHKIFWIAVAIIVVARLSTLLEFLKECLSEPVPGCPRGKGSSKRLILFLFSVGFLYAWIYSIHAKTHLDPYVSSFIIVFLLLGLAIIKPGQAGNLLDKLKSLTTFIPEKKGTDAPEVEVKTSTEVKIDQQ